LKGIYCSIFGLQKVFINVIEKVFLLLKGQSHEKVGEMRVEGDSLGPN
jgi:hypothetical protein